MNLQKLTRTVEDAVSADAKVQADLDQIITDHCVSQASMNVHGGKDQAQEDGMSRAESVNNDGVHSQVRFLVQEANWTSDRVLNLLGITVETED